MVRQKKLIKRRAMPKAVREVLNWRSFASADLRHE